MNRHARLLAIAAGAILVAGCGTKPPRDSHDDHDAKSVRTDHAEPGSVGDGAEERHADSVPLAEVRGVRFVRVPPPVREGAWYPAEAAGDESARAVLTSPVSGVVDTAPIAPGRRVSPGAVLVTMKSAELAELFARWRTARARLERAQAELSREERLLAAGATAARDVEVARSEALAARAEEEAARLGLETRGASTASPSSVLAVRAPAAGSVVGWEVRVGEGVVAGRPLGSFQSARAALVIVEIPLPGPTWKSGDETGVRASDGQTWSARVESVPAALGDASRRLHYRLRLLAGPYPLPGRPLEVRVPYEEGVVLPQTALQQVEGSWGLFVKEGETATFRKVRRGPELGSDVMVIEGAVPGEEVATEGAYLLKSLLLKRAGGGDDDH